MHGGSARLYYYPCTPLPTQSISSTATFMVHLPATLRPSESNTVKRRATLDDAAPPTFSRDDAAIERHRKRASLDSDIADCEPGVPFRLRRLLPAAPSPESVPAPNPKPFPRRKRSAVPMACCACQKAKAKCNGATPTCYRCQSRAMECEYDVEARLCRAASNLKQSMQVADENTQLHELLNHLKTRTWAEAVEILRRIREASDPMEVIQFVRDADLILQPSQT